MQRTRIARASALPDDPLSLQALRRIRRNALLVPRDKKSRWEGPADVERRSVQLFFDPSMGGHAGVDRRRSEWT